MLRRPQGSTRTDTRFPDPTRVRSVAEGAGGTALIVGGVGEDERRRVKALVTRCSSGQSLVETLASHLLLHGNAYVQVMTGADGRSEEHTSELQSLMRISYAVFCLQKKTKTTR